MAQHLTLQQAAMITPGMHHNTAQHVRLTTEIFNRSKIELLTQKYYKLRMQQHNVVLVAFGGADSSHAIGTTCLTATSGYDHAWYAS
jgi:hypothetical protein